MAIVANWPRCLGKATLNPFSLIPDLQTNYLSYASSVRLATWQGAHGAQMQCACRDDSACLACLHNPVCAGEAYETRTGQAEADLRCRALQLANSSQSPREDLGALLR